MSSKREEIEPTPGDKRRIRRNKDGEIDTSVELHRSHSQGDKHDA